MKNIQITTPQNVRIEHSIAPLMLRFIGFVIDQLVVYFSLFLVFMLAALFKAPNFIIELVIPFAYVLIYLMYSLLFETFNHGQSVGKMVVGIKVKRMDGSDINFTEALIRWIMRVPDIFISAGSLASVLIHASEKGQRMGDILAGTVVLKNVNRLPMKLENLHKISSISAYKPVYDQAGLLNENDVVFIKNTLLRAGKYKNVAHKIAVDLLATKIENLLAIKRENLSSEAFLKTIIKDFIVLTR